MLPTTLHHYIAGLPTTLTLLKYCRVSNYRFIVYKTQCCPLPFHCSYHAVLLTTLFLFIKRSVADYPLIVETLQGCHNPLIVDILQGFQLPFHCLLNAVLPATLSLLIYCRVANYPLIVDILQGCQLPSHPQRQN